MGVTLKATVAATIQAGVGARVRAEIAVPTTLSGEKHERDVPSVEGRPPKH